MHVCEVTDREFMRSACYACAHKPHLFTQVCVCVCVGWRGGTEGALPWGF